MEPKVQIKIQSPAPRRIGWLYVSVAAVFAILYALTAQKGPAWQDSGIFQWRIWTFQLQSHLGLALSHPLLIVLGKLTSALPFGTLFWRMNLVSVLAGAFAVANVATLVRRLAPRSRLAPWAVAGMLGLAHTTWWLSTICESQTLLLAIFTAELHVVLSLVRDPRPSHAALLGLLNGLALTAHNLALLALPGYGLVVLVLCARRRLPVWVLPAMVLAWGLGASGYLAMIVTEARTIGLTGAIRSALFGRSWQKDVLGGTGRAVVMGIGYVVYNFPHLGLPLAAVGLLRLRRLGEGLFTALGVYLLGVYLLFAVRYPVADQFMFFLPCYAMIAMWAGWGVAEMEASSRRIGRLIARAGLAMVLLAPVVYFVAPVVWKVAGLPLPGRTDLPRDNTRIWLQPWKTGEESAGDFTRSALQNTPAGSILIADNTAYPPLRFGQEVWGLGEGVTLRNIDDAVPAGIPRDVPVYVTSDLPGYYPRWMADEVALVRSETVPVLFRVHWQSPAGGMD